MSNKKVSQIVKQYENAINTNLWDYEEGHEFKSSMEVFELVMQGKTIYMFARQSAIEFGTITGCLMAFLSREINKAGHCSQSTKKAIRRGVLFAQDKLASVNN
jgi:hypothetical protein